MENQNQITGDEMKEALEKYFGGQLGNFACQNLLLEKRIEAQVEFIAMLQAEIAHLRAELSRRPPAPLSPEAAALAAAGSALLASDGDEGNKKAAPVEAA
jgi:uncharacterized small protein (DUF1192 family)